MPKQRHSAEGIISKLREVEVLQAKGQNITEARANRRLALTKANYLSTLH